jgi:hypothetical protein
LNGPRRPDPEWPLVIAAVLIAAGLAIVFWAIVLTHVPLDDRRFVAGRHGEWHRSKRTALSGRPSSNTSPTAAGFLFQEQRTMTLTEFQSTRVWHDEFRFYDADQPRPGFAYCDGTLFVEHTGTGWASRVEKDFFQSAFLSDIDAAIFGNFKDGKWIG